MDVSTVSEATWRFYPAAVLAFSGLVVLAKGLWFGFTGSKGLLHEREALGWIRGFRLAVVGLTATGIAVAWASQTLWLFVASVGILGEEMLETTVMVEALKRAPGARPSGAA